MPNSEQTRTLHPLDLPERLCDPGNAELRRAVFVDVETTGLGHEHDDVIELAALPFTYTLDGRVVEVLHDEAQVHRQDPGRPLPAEITHLTGLTDDDLRGERIDVEAVTALIERCGLVVRAQRRLRPCFRREGPAPPRAENPGRAVARRFPGRRRVSRARPCIACSAPSASTPRTATARSRTARPGCGSSRNASPCPGVTVLAALRERALAPTERLWARKAPFESKDLLRARGYRWMPHMREAIERSWWTELAPDKLEAELEWLGANVYPHGTYLPLPRRKVTAHERWRPDPTGCEPLDPVLVPPPRTTASVAAT